MDLEERRECFTHAIAMLENLLTLTDKQIVCIQQDEMRGLRRLMRERDTLFQKLMAVVAQLRSDATEQRAEPCSAMAHTMAFKQQQVLAHGREALQLLILARNQAAAQIRHIREREQVTNHYVRHWLAPRPGNWINAAR